MKQPALAKYIESEFGSAEDVYREILGDFFRHGYVALAGGLEICWFMFFSFLALTDQAQIISLMLGHVSMAV